jgi:hypothetical protein
LHHVGAQISTENILLLVLGAPLLVAGLICLLLTTPILSKKLKLDDQMFSYLLGSGSSLVLSSVLCLAALLL